MLGEGVYPDGYNLKDGAFGQVYLPPDGVKGATLPNLRSGMSVSVFQLPKLGTLEPIVGLPVPYQPFGCQLVTVAFTFQVGALNFHHLYR
jgi:hypothetical protein